MSDIPKRLKEMRQRLGVLPKALRLLWQVSTWETGFLVALLLLQGLVPAFGIYLSKLVIDRVMALVQGSDAGLALWQLVALWGVTLLVGTALTPWVMLVQGNLTERLGAEVELLLIRKANTLADLSVFENSQFYNDLQILSQQARYRPLNLMVTTVGVGRDLITLAALLTLLATLAWWLLLLVLAATVPQGWLETRLQKQSWLGYNRQSPEVRQMAYLTQVALSDQHAKEVRLFSLGGFLEDRYKARFSSHHTTMRTLRKRQAFTPIPTVLLSLVGNVAAFAWVVGRAVTGALSAGNVLLLVQSLAQLQQRLSGLTMYTGFIYEHLLFFDKLFAFLELTPPMPRPHPGKPIPKPLTHGIRFEQVSFAYPDGREALCNVSFVVYPGERVAIVGENGAGKTTLVKLLARLYDPSAGRIVVDGVDLRDLDLEAWRARIGTTFQDFGRYHFTVRENIGLGWLEGMDDPERIQNAAAQAGFAETAQRLPQGYDTQLGKPFDGTELSGGQWQKLALARAFMRPADLLILDEPTAALDPRAEHALYEQFAALTVGRTTLLITHRLASVTMADRILVIREGRLVEEGTHAELMRRGGEYAALYQMQAKHYRSDVSVE